ncbi:MAG: quinol:cytochrome C oxidoreductase [Deltaproteobacteria bacterium]|nr:MAG: quinol:cytochrome C oxidoreductase [Deltaproteobacteria bacterium]
MSAHASPSYVPTEAATVPKASLWRKLPIPLAAIGLGALALAFVLGSDETGKNPQFWFSYLTSFAFWLSIGLGGFVFVLIHHATRAGWSTVVRRIAENFMITLPLMGVLGLALAFGGANTLYEWTTPELVHNQALLAKKTWWLEEGFFQIRAVIYLALWILVPMALYRWSTKQDITGDEDLSHKMRRWAPLGAIAFALTLTFSIIDFTMSLDWHWYSTIYGVYYFGAAMMMIGIALSLTSMTIQRSGLLKDHITTEHYHDLGKWTFAFMVFWSYIAFSQFMLIWYANIPEETLWFAYRVEGGWEVVTLLLALLHFVVPFFFLMSRHIKRRKATLIAGSVLLIIAHYIDMFWLVQPKLSMRYFGGGHHAFFSISIVDLLAFIGIGGLFLAVVTWRMAAKPVAPVKDPRLAESLSFENQNY